MGHGAYIPAYVATVAGQASQEQAGRLAELADEALKAWKKEGHPGWSVDSMECQNVQQLDQQQVPSQVSIQLCLVLPSTCSSPMYP